MAGKVGNDQSHQNREPDAAEPRGHRLRDALGEPGILEEDSALDRLVGDGGLARLRGAVSTKPPEAVCVLVMGALVGREHPGDDIALLVLRWQPEAP